MKTAQHRKKKQAHAWNTKFVVFSYIMSGSEEVWCDVRPKAVGKKRPRSIDELCSESSESTSTFDAMTARWYEALETLVAATLVRAPISACASSSWRLSSDWSGRSSGGPTYKKEIHRPPCSQCRSVDRRCFACCSRDARDAEGRAVDRKHDRARMRTTAQRTTGDQSTDSHAAQVCDAHHRLGSDSEVVMLEKESDGMHGPCVTFLSNRRTGEFFPELGGSCSRTCKPSTDNVT